MSHYYSENADLKSNPMEFELEFRQNKYRFKTDSGVFSKTYLDFGTKTLLESFVMPLVEGPILDLGCGYGPVGVILGKETGRKIIMVDINERALKLSSENLLLNGVEAKVLKSDSLSNINEQFAVILTNPPIRAGKNVVFSFYEESKKQLLPNGELWVVIQKKQGAESSIKKLNDLFGNCTVVNREKGYLILKSTR